MNDNFFWHTASVKTCNQILYSVFHEGNGDIWIGAGHCLLSRADSFYLAAPDRFTPSQEEYEQYAQSVYELQEKLEQNGKRFVYLFSPLKVRIYPDMISWNYRLIRQTHEISGPDKRERMIAAFEKYGVNYYDLTDDLLKMREKGDFDVFSLTGLHWTLTAVASEMNTLFKNLSPMTPGIDYPEVNVVGLTNDVFDVDKDLYNAINIYSGVESEEYTSPVIDYPRTSSSKVYLIGTSMGSEIYYALTRDPAHPAFDQLIYQSYSTYQLIRSKEGETAENFRETDPPEALHIMEYIQDSDLILMEQPWCNPNEHNKFLTFANEHIDKLYYHPGDNIVTDYEGATGASVDGDYGLEENTFCWVKKECKASVSGDELKKAGGDIRLSISAVSYHADQSLRILVNGEDMGVYQISPSGGEIEVLIPAELIEPETNTVELSMLGDPYSPKQLGEAEDTRLLGFALRSMVLEVSE